MYTQNIQKQLTVIAGVSGGLICEIKIGDFKTLKAFKTELKTVDSLQAFCSDEYNQLMQTNSLEEAQKILTTLQNAAAYKLVKIELDSYGVGCCGYTEAGRMITIYNNKAQFTLDNSKPSYYQVQDFINKWCK